MFQVTDAVLPEQIGRNDPRRREYNKKIEHKRKRKPRTKNCEDWRMIAWDGEGIKLAGEHFPQNYVLFGSSADPANPLIIKENGERLQFTQIVDYALDIAMANPNCFHVGYFFRYDQNMIIQTLTALQKTRLYETQRVSVKVGNYRYAVKWIPGKRITLSKRNLTTEKVQSIRIDDFATFLGKSFIAAYEALCSNMASDSQKAILAEGKANRSLTTFYDLPKVKEYWQTEIVMLEQLATTFRDIIYAADFKLIEWYGPGALANYLRKTLGLVQHEWGGKEENMPRAVHDASKRAYFGGRFEQFKVGRITGPIYVYDINSAYPYGFTRLPTLAEGGFWRRVEKPSSYQKDIFGVYRVEWHYSVFGSIRAFPLPIRLDGFPGVFGPRASGWYWHPEIQVMHELENPKHYSIIEGWEWVPIDPLARPWSFIEDMFTQRLELKGKGSPVEMAYKLAMNSLYGKMAQRIGWDEDTFKPPKAHTLPIAGWITSNCRSMIYYAAKQIPHDHLIAIETDSIITTYPLHKHGLPIGKDLGQWDMAKYDEIIMLQSGLYLYRIGTEWRKPKSRGMDAESLTEPLISRYLTSLRPGEKWEPLLVPQKERFIGLGAAISRSRQADRTLNPHKMNQLHCRWESTPRELLPGMKGKRIHVAKACRACIDGYTPNSKPHDLMSNWWPNMPYESQPYVLPWEKEYQNNPIIEDMVAKEDELSVNQT